MLQKNENGSLIAKVAEMKELYATEAAPSYSATGDEFGYECMALNAVPAMLAILEQIRPGDAEIFETLIDYLESNHGGTEYEDLELSVMRRYQAMAERMEAKGK